ncbi:hypothetical protein ABZ927_13965 [Streptomyces massasporeus]
MAEPTGRTSGSATRLVGRPERAGLVGRRPDAHDRRRTCAPLTTRRSPEAEAA